MTETAVAAAPTSVAASDAPAIEPRPVVLASRWLQVNAPVALVLAACAWWVLMATRLWGGRGAGAVSGGAILTALAVLAIQPHRYVPRGAIGFALAVSVAAFGVALTAPTGWAGATTAASYVCVSWTVVAVAAAVVRDPRVPDLLVGLTVLGVLVELAESWLAWWGGSSAAQPLIGTFYWYDPFAAFLIAGTTFGLSVWLRHRGAMAALGLAGLIAGTIGLVYSTSRAADACFAVAVMAVLVAELVSRRVAGVRRSAIALIVTSFAVWAIGGPPFFAHRSLPFAGTSARASGQSLSQNGGYRDDFWHEAIGVFQRHPLSGGGFHSLASESVGHNPQHWPLSPLAHSGYLQALSDGGLLLAVPFLAAVALLAWWVVTALWRAVRGSDFSTAGFVVPLSLGALLMHSAVDFDWSYAADFTLTAILAGLVAGARWGRRHERVAPRPSARGRRVVAVMALAGVGLLGVAAATAWSGDLRQSLPVAASSGPVSAP